MFDVKGNLHRVLDTLPQGVRLVAISKYHPDDYILAAYEEGQRIFGESHEQERRQKHESLPKDIEWHFIGHLQTNKVKYIVPSVRLRNATGLSTCCWSCISLRKPPSMASRLTPVANCWLMANGVGWHTCASAV